ncbi:site-specific DNA-methyltransferase [Antarctobacter sp.]|uniref:site-specific DNA-methyltransferase n=1 Tax=Antarctobacter sp. TaxID=1872577 RepID=UPI002B26F3FE|nr:site-specific DNA-methyltransferase [Antarctobacter sp.]
MQNVTPQDGQSADIISENIEKLQEMFPDVFTEGGVNFDVLRQLLGDASLLDEGEEKYGLNWYGKKAARKISLAPSTGTLLPCHNKSIDWDTTQNLFIEGDNLEVLKLLQKSYAGQVKMIFIDPPYNTGGEFIYPDNFADNLDTYLKYTGQLTDQGQKLSSNTESSGRYHTNWLNMMYPRLKLAKNMLASNGAIFISIDDNECGNLEQICNEIFGRENFVAKIVWEKVYTPKSNGRVISTDHDYVLVYCKGPAFFESGWNYLPRSEEQSSRFSNADNDPKGPWRTYPMDVRTENSQKREKYRYQVKTPSGRLVKPSPGRHWALPEAKFLEELEAGRIYFGKAGDAMPTKKVYLSEARDGVIARTWWSYKEVGGNQTAKQELIDLFEGDPGFLTPKPISLIRRMLHLTASEDSLVLDFFAGSCSTAHAVLKENAESNSRMRYICVQLPEPCDRGTAAHQAGYTTISALGVERIKRAAERIKKEHPAFNGDLGFKFFKLSGSNIRAWNPDRTDLEESLLSHKEHLVEGRTEQDVLYELLLKRGIELTVPIEERQAAGKTIHSIGYGVLFACLDRSIAATDVDKVAQGILDWQKELAPETDTHVFFRDSAFADDIAKTNMAAILEQNGISHVRSL